MARMQYLGRILSLIVFAAFAVARMSAGVDASESGDHLLGLGSHQVDIQSNARGFMRPASRTAA